MLTLVSLCLKTPADMTPHVRECCSQRGGRSHTLMEMGQRGRADSQAQGQCCNCTVLPSFIFISKLLRNL
jgi:hypothetical protein